MHVELLLKPIAVLDLAYRDQYIHNIPTNDAQAPILIFEVLSILRSLQTIDSIARGIFYRRKRDRWMQAHTASLAHPLILQALGLL